MGVRVIHSLSYRGIARVMNTSTSISEEMDIDIDGYRQ